MRRTFIVGCPRSGTTVVQALLARHPDVATLPETAFFEHMYGELRWRWGDAGVPRRSHRSLRLGLARRLGRRALLSLHAEVGQGRARAPLRLDACVGGYVRLLDEYAARMGRTMWIEKTPNHLLYLPEIERAVPGVCVVHVVRNGLDVVASIADANLRYDHNHDFGGGAKHWARRWNHAMALHARHLGRPGHHFVFLDDLVRDTAHEWRRLYAALGLDPDAPLAGACTQAIADLADEPWKRQALDGEVCATRSKATALFGPDLLDWLSQRLVSIEPLRRQCRARPGGAVGVGGTAASGARPDTSRRGRVPDAAGPSDVSA